MGTRPWAAKRRSLATARLALCLIAPIGLAGPLNTRAQESEPTEPYRFYGGPVDRQEKNAAVEACEYRLLVEEQRCNDALNKTACIARVHEACLADPEGGGDSPAPDDRRGERRR